MIKKILSPLLLLTLSGCSLGNPSWLSPKTEQAKKISIVTTFYPLEFFAKSVGGAYVEVTTIIPTGVEPHDFEPKPSDIARIQESQMVVLNGAGLDPWAEKALRERDRTRVQIINAEKSIQLLVAPENIEEHGDAHDTHHTEPESTSDPHFWLDPAYAQQIVEQIKQALETIDPIHAVAYQYQADSIKQELSDLDRDFQIGLSACRLDNIVTSHAAFGYLARRYGFHQIPISGISPENEPSLPRLQEISNLIMNTKIRYIFFETLVQPKVAQTLANDLGVQVAIFNPLEGLTPGEQAQGKNYLSIMRENLSALRQGMECK